MADARDIKDLHERQARVLRRHPDLARTIGHVRVRLARTDGWQVAAPDTSPRTPQAAGATSGEGPEGLLRASVASALALGYCVWAARLEVPVEEIEVEVQTEEDRRGQLLPDSDAQPGWLRLGILTTFRSAAAEADLRHVCERAHRHNLVLATLSSAIERRFELRVLPP